MSKAHYIAPTIPQQSAQTVRLGTTGAKFVAADEGKFVKLAAESQYNLCAVGDAIEGIVSSVETASSGGFSTGGIYDEATIFALADGLQATPGTGAIAIGDYVVTGTITALNTTLPSYPKVCKATAQPFAVPADLTTAAAQIKNSIFAWRVISLGTAGTGAVGTTIVVQRAN